MLRRITMTALLLAAAVSAAPAADTTESERQIRAALDAWVAAANRGDMRAALQVWAPDLIGWAPEGEDDSYAREAAGAEQASRSTGAPRMRYRVAVDEIIVDGSLAVVRDTWTQTTQRDAAPDQITTFRSFEVWRRQPNASWKISRWIDGPVKPAAAPH